MEGRTQQSRSMNVDTMVGYGDPGVSGGGTYTGSSTDATQAMWDNIFGPAGRDVRNDQQRHKRHQRWHLPDVLKGPNTFLTDRVDGLITDSTNSPFTTYILPYLYVDNPDQKFKWNVYSFDEGLASRVPYEAAARVLTQTKRSYSAYAVRNGLGIEMEHNFMMSPAGMLNFQRQMTQLVGSIQQSNDLDVHVALIQAQSYAKEYMEKYSTIDKTPYQICREYVDLFGMVQKNPNALDILIEEAKIQFRLWGAPMPNFLLCNSKLTFQLTMNPDRTNYITQGIDGVKRLRAGPDIPKYRDLNIIHSRSYTMETGAPPRDVLRRRVRVAEYYRVPPQRDRTWEIELYDESRDTWFKLTPEDLDRYADLSGGGSPNGGNVPHLHANDKYDWDTFLAAGGGLDIAPYQLKMIANDPDDAQTTVIMPRTLRPSETIEWYQSLNVITTANGGAYLNEHARPDYPYIVNSLAAARAFVPRPNHTNFSINVDFPTTEPRNIPFWLFMHAAFLDGVCSFLWTPIDSIDRNLVRDKIIPFICGGAHPVVVARYNAIPDGARLNPFHTVMFLGCAMRWHPDDDVRRILEQKFADRRISLHALRASLVNFVKRCIDDTGVEPPPENRIQLGKRLDQIFAPNRNNSHRLPRADEARAIYDRWPASPPGVPPIHQAARVSDTHHTLDDYLVEDAFRRDPATYPWNTIPRIELAVNNEYAIHEPTVLDSFFHAAIRRMLTRTDDADDMVPDFWPILRAKGTVEEVEYVIVRPVIEYNTLSVILGKGGSSEEQDGLGATVWGQTEVSCYDDSMHGVWGMNYKYHSRALVINSRNLIRLFDVSMDGYNGGKDDRPVSWSDEAPGNYRPFNAAVGNLNAPYNGPSMMVMRYTVNTGSREYRRNWPSPIVFHDKLDPDGPTSVIDPDGIYRLSDPSWRVFNQSDYREQYRAYLQRMPDFTYYHAARKPPGHASVDQETSQGALAFQGSMRLLRPGLAPFEIVGSGHTGPDYVGVAMVRAGKGTRPIVGAPTAMRLVA